jgi:16S rRNA (guanine966-N2)-methyltransferase
MLSSRLGSFGGLRIADLFAGSGALGFEALSRGAAHATFVEADSKASATIRKNAELLGASERIAVIGGSALSLPRARPFDLIFADPPYAKRAGSAAVQSVIDSKWLAEGGWIAVETARGDSVDPGPLALDIARDFSRARITLLRRV